MKKILLGALSLLVVLSLSFKVKANNTVAVNIVASLSTNETIELLAPQNKNVTYGETFNVTASTIEGEVFAYWIVDGIVDFSREASTEFVATNNFEAIAVYHKSDNYAITFVDHSGKLIETKYVSDLGSVTEPNELPTKYGYEYNNPKWQLVHGSNNSFEDINENKVFKLRYKLIDSLDKIIINGNEYDYNQIVTIEATKQNFSHFEENGKVVSYSSSYSFSALYDRNIVEVTNGLEKPLVTLSDNLNIRPGYISKLGQIYLPSNLTLIETGYLVSQDIALALTIDNATIVKANKVHPLTNEFLISINNNYPNIRGYLVYRDNNSVVHTIYSDLVAGELITENFETQTALTASYLDGSFTSKGIVYTYGHSRNQDTFEIDGKGILLRRGSDSFIEFTLPIGIDYLSFQYRKAYTGGSNNRQLEIYINDVLVETTAKFGLSGTDLNVHTFVLSNINITTAATIKIKPAGNSDTNTQITIDNLSFKTFGPEIEGVTKNTLTFNTVGGDAIAPMTVNNGMVVELPTPTKFGYTFLGWHLSSDYSDNPLDSEYQVLNNVTLYANWEQLSGTFNVTYVLDNGQNDITQAVSANSQLTPPVVTNGALVLAGWYLDDEFEFKWDLNNDYVISNMTLYAKWAPLLSERTQIGIVRQQLQDDPDYNNAADIGLEPSYFHVVGYKSGSNRPGVYDELRFYTGTALSFDIHESFVIRRIVISNNSSTFTVTSNGVTLTNLNNLDITSFKITNNTGARVDTNYIEIYYYQVGPNVVKEDDINRPVFDFGEDSLYEFNVGTTFTIPSFNAEDVEDITVEGSVDMNKSTIPNPNLAGIYYIHYSAIDSDENVGVGYITVIYRDNNWENNYYGNLLSLADNQLENQIISILSNSINLVTYAKAKDALEEADRDPNNFDNVWLIYNSASIVGKWQSPNYAREHVWAKSAFGGNHSIVSDYDGDGVKFTESYRGAASDLHNLRAINQSVNSTHSNFEFGDNNGLTHGEWQLLSLSSRLHNPYTPGKENDVTTNVFYPGKDHKGDVARIIFYMMLMWDLTPREDISMLVEWHLDDPVDNFEIIRNEVIFGYQNNRNPFIDYPELVERIFVN